MCSANKGQCTQGREHGGGTKCEAPGLCNRQDEAAARIGQKPEDKGFKMKTLSPLLGRNLDDNQLLSKNESHSFLRNTHNTHKAPVGTESTCETS